MTAGLSCDGDTISITAATQPSVEDVVMGAIPGLPKVHLHNPVLAYEVGDDFMKYFYQAEQGLIDPFIIPTSRGSACAATFSTDCTGTKCVAGFRLGSKRWRAFFRQPGRQAESRMLKGRML